MKGLGPVLIRDVTKKLQGKALLKTRVSSGLSRPEFFNWGKALKRYISLDSYDFIVILLGTNDSQNFLFRGKPLNYGTKKWMQIYSQRLNRFMALACNGAKKVLWVGLPPMRSKRFNRKVAQVNMLAKHQAQKYECLDYIPIGSVVGDKKVAIQLTRK